jgi:hypothetical protein
MFFPFAEQVAGQADNGQAPSVSNNGQTGMDIT